MMLSRLGSVLLVLLFVTSALAGCHGLEGEDDSDPTPSPTTSPTPTNTTAPTATPTVTPTGTPEPDAPDVQIALVDVPESVTVGDTITINITVEGDEIQATAADLYFAYNSTEPINRSTLAPDHFNGSLEGNGNTTFPGRYVIENWTIDGNQTLFVRGHVLYQGDHFWSDESVIAVNEPEEPTPIGKIATIKIDTYPDGVPCALANFQGEGGGAINPTKTTIEVGDAVVFVSQEKAEGCVHTGTSTADPPVFDTDEIQNGETTEPIQFLVAGTYEFECTYHPDTMTGSIEVQPKVGG